MVAIENTKLFLEKNQQMTDNLKINFLELVTIFHEAFPEVSLDNLNERISTLIIERGTKFLNRDALEYDCKNNILSISEALLQEEQDAKHALMVAILKMITAKENFYGLASEEKYTALNIGITEVIAEFLVGNESE